VDEKLQMLRMARKQGVDTATWTPHYYRG